MDIEKSIIEDNNEYEEAPQAEKLSACAGKCSFSAALRRAFKMTLPVMAGYLFLGAAFGMLLSSKGYSPLWAALMSVTVYAGAMQFVAVELLASPVSALTAAIITLSVNARHLFYGVSMLEKYRGTGRLKPYLIFSLTDETYSLLSTASVPKGESKGRFYFLASFLNQLYWIAGGIARAFFGSGLSFELKGLDFSMTALFIVIFIEQWKASERHLPAVTGLLATALCLLLFGADSFIIPSMLLITLLLLLSRRIQYREVRK